MTNDKDFEVFIEKKPKFHQHVAKTVNKASRIHGLVRITLTSPDLTTVLHRHFTMTVHPLLEYGNLSDVKDPEGIKSRSKKCTIEQLS